MRNANDITKNATEIRPAPVPVYIDADVLICGSVSTTNAPHAILRLAEAHLIEGVVCVHLFSSLIWCCDENLDLVRNQRKTSSVNFLNKQL